MIIYSIKNNLKIIITSNIYFVNMEIMLVAIGGAFGKAYLFIRYIRYDHDKVLLPCISS